MVVNAHAAAFAPAAHPQVVIAADGTLAAIHEPSRVVVVEIPTCSPFAELGIDAASTSTDVAWVGTPPRLLVLSRYSAHSIVHLVDPFGPRTIAEMRLEAPMKLFASVGTHALVIGSLGAGVLAATDKSLVLYQFPARTRPVTAGAAGGNFMVALSTTIEEWDPQSRMPKRRLKLPRPAVITAVGGSDRVVWMTTQQEPARIDVIPLVNRGQPKAHDLPEPIGFVASHPRSDLVVCAGASSGRVWVIDLDGRHGLRVIGPEGIDKVEAAGLVLGRVTGVLAAQAQRPLAIVGLDRRDEASGPVAVAREHSAATAVPREAAASREPSGSVAVPRESAAGVFASREGAATAREPTDAIPMPRASGDLRATGDPSRSVATRGDRADIVGGPRVTTRRAEPTPMTELVARSSLYADDDVDAMPTAVTLSSPAMPEPEKSATALRGREPGLSGDGREPRPREAEPETFRDAKEPASFSQVRAPELAVKPDPRIAPGRARPTTPEGLLAAWRERMKRPRGRTVEVPAQLWPDAPPTWRDDALAWARSVLGGAPDADVSADSPFAALVARFDLSPMLQPVLALLYGLHLAGIAGASPAEVARLTGGWDEALGRGELAQQGVALYRESRVVLAPSVQRVLDELPPETGTLVGTPGVCSLLGPCTIVSAGPLAIVAEACSSSIGGAILASYDGKDPVELVREARAYGAAPMLRVAPRDLERVSVDDPIILVVEDDATADALGIPRLR